MRVELKTEISFVVCFVSNSLQPHGLQHTGLPCPSLSPRVCPNSCPLSQWCHPNVSCSVTPFSSWPQSLPASCSFPMSRLFASGGQSIRTSASVFPMNIQGWFPLEMTGFLSKGVSRVWHTLKTCPLSSLCTHELPHPTMPTSQVCEPNKLLLF